MTPEIYEEVAKFLKRPQPLSQVHAFIRESGSSWSVAQLQLFLTCLKNIELDTTSSEVPLVRIDERSPQAALLDAVIEIVASRGGKPIPAAQILRLLPSQFMTTEAQIKSLAKGSRELEVFGSGLLRLKNI